MYPIARNTLVGSRSWADVVGRIESLPDNKAKGDLFEQVVRSFLLIDPTYQALLDEVWLLRDVPPAVRGALELNEDIGIDLVCKTREGKYWAVQAKYRSNPHQPLSWKADLSTFAGLVAGRPFEQSLVATSTIDISGKAKTGLKGNFTFLKHDVWSHLGEEFFTQLDARQAGKQVVFQPRTPRPHQIPAVEDVVRSFSDAPRCKLLMACGTGKTLTAYFVAEKMEARRVLIAVPNLGLARQILREWMREAVARGHRPRIMVVCSDPTIEKSNRSGDDEDEALSVAISDMGIHVTTSVPEATEFLRKRGECLVVTTYHSGETTAEAARAAGAVFDLGIFDEAHKTVGQKGKAWSHLLFEENIRISKRLFMTATERVFRAMPEGVELMDMDDVEHYGARAHSLTFVQALDQGLLCDYRVITLETTSTRAEKLLTDRRIVVPKGHNRATRIEMLAAALELLDGMQRFGVRHVISYHSSVKRARSFEKLVATLLGLPRYQKLPLKTFHLNGSDSATRRDDVMQQAMASGYAVVTNCRCLTEGIDVPAIDGVAFIDAKQSKVDVVQAVGRALRRADGKQLGYVFVPAVLRKGTALDDLTKGPYAATAQVISSMGTMDDDIVAMVNAISQGERWSGARAAPFRLPVGVRVDPEKFARELALRIHRRLTWRRADYSLIEQFVREGWGTREIMAKLGCSTTPIMIVRTRLGIRDPARKDLARIEKFIRQGLGTNEIAEKVGCSTGPVAAMRRKLKIRAPRFRNNALIDKLVRAGKSNPEIMRAAKCSVSTVVSRRTKLGIADTNVREATSTRALVERLIRRGMGNNDIAKQAGCSKPTVARARRRLGVRAPRFRDLALIEKLIRRGCTDREIMEKARCSRPSVTRARKRIGVHRPGGKPS